MDRASTVYMNNDDGFTAIPDFPWSISGVKSSLLQLEQASTFKVH